MVKMRTSDATPSDLWELGDVTGLCLCKIW